MLPVAAIDRGLVWQTPSGIYTGRTRANARRYAAGTLVGLSVDALLPAGLRDAHARHREAYMAQPRSRPMGAGLDLVGQRRDGSEFAVEISLSPIAMHDGPLVMAAIRDITGRASPA